MQNPAQNNTGSMGTINVMVCSGHGFTTADGPPPGLSAHPGLGLGETPYDTNSNGDPYLTPGFANDTSGDWGFHGALATGGPN